MMVEFHLQKNDQFCTDNPNMIQQSRKVVPTILASTFLLPVGISDKSWDYTSRTENGKGSTCHFYSPIL